MSEHELVRRARNGDMDAFEQLVRAYQDRIYALAFRRSGDREEASDLAQEIFLRVWQNLNSFREESEFSTWVYRLANNLCIDYIRTRNRQHLTTFTMSLDDEEAPFPEPADWSQDPQLHLEQAELGRAVRRGLNELPKHFRDVVTLREIAELSYQEIAERLNIDMGTVKSRLARGRAQLIKILRRDGNIPLVYSSKTDIEEEKGTKRSRGRKKGGKPE